MRPGAEPRGKPAEGSDHGRTSEWTGQVSARTLPAGCRPPPAGPRHRDSPYATARAPIEVWIAFITEPGPIRKILTHLGTEAVVFSPV
jgi:hypothetical protein